MKNKDWKEEWKEITEEEWDKSDFNKTAQLITDAGGKVIARFKCK